MIISILSGVNAHARWRRVVVVAPRPKLNGALDFTERAAVEGMQVDSGVASIVRDDELPFDPFVLELHLEPRLGART